MSEYCRVYYDVIDDPKFKDIYPDKVALGWWLTLLLIADAMWPASAPLPYGIDEQILARLVKRDIVIVEGPMYRLKGLDKERSQRSRAAADAARMRWHSDRNATASSSEMPSQAKPSQAKPSLATRESDDDIVAVYHDLTLRTPKKTVMEWLDRLVSQDGFDAVVAAMQQEWTSDPDPSTFLGRVESTLQVASRKEAKAREEARKQAALEARRAEQERIASLSPEEKAAAEAARQRVADAVSAIGRTM